ncbi:hypothetical protein ColLi_01695 [Colletotrichum liriopes]|uniref:Uncharacterized protein n=1 Tax=Colletotrichum liriopes TaxID=708192 RepID=A0AA37GE57_9PEZI|nr:hypothetical protein ColLi_01695 [Colletotrichum liriopes]
MTPSQVLNEVTPTRPLQQRGIRVHMTGGKAFPAEAAMPDRGAVAPAIVVSPERLPKDAHPYGRLSVSVKSGGYDYYNGARGTGLILSLAGTTKRRVSDETLFPEPSCIVGQTSHALATYRKAVPHGDFFGFDTDEHFLTAGWDLILGWRYGLRC